jgi:hypothetical protein
MVESPAAAFAGTLTVNCCGEMALTLRGNVGVVVAPAGRPLIVTDTMPAKPFTATTETVTGKLVSPCATLRALDERASLKSPG